ncbi:MAG: T9SS type A sorting domain-containing protein [Bacteroidota bacterium]
MNKFFTILTSLLILSSSAHTQQLGRISLGSTHAQVHLPTISLTYSVGEPVIGTAYSGTIILTKGFQQPDPSGNSFPVEWLHLSVEQVGEDARLRWTTASEENSDYFDVERSLDAQQFVSIGQVDAAGSSQDLSNYEFVDPRIGTLGSSRIYYRLRQVDLDGQFSYSSLLTLTILPSSELQFSVYPNPTSGFLQLDYQFPEGSATQLSLLDMRGKMLFSKNLPSNIGTHQLDLSDLTKGVYLLELQATHLRQVKRIVLQ